MPDPGRIYQVVEKHRRDLLRNERTAASAMVREYGAAWQRVRAQLDALIAQIEEAQRAGKKVSPAWLFQQNRLQSLLYQVEAEIARFVDYAEPEIARQQRAAVEAAQRHVWEQVSVLTDDVTILAKFDRLAAEAVSDLIGFTEAGPLRELLDGLGPQVSKGFREAMIESLVIGRNPRETARRVRREFGVGLARALRISRTETLRAHREATRRNYRENSDIVEGWVWLASKSARTCAMCLAMDGTFHTLDERLDDHPGGRCVMAPAVKGVRRPQRETGAEWFEKQDETTQRKVLGNAGYEAYKAGEVKLQDFVGQRWSRDWGTIRYARSLTQILGADEAKKWGKKASLAVSDKSSGWKNWTPNRPDARLVGQCGDQLKEVLANVTGVRDVYVSTNTRNHYVEKHGRQMNIERAETMLKSILADPESVYQGKKKSTLVFVGEYDENHYLVAPVKALPGELWLESLYLHNKQRLGKRKWAKQRKLYGKKK